MTKTTYESVSYEVVISFKCGEVSTSAGSGHLEESEVRTSVDLKISFSCLPRESRGSASASTRWGTAVSNWKSAKSYRQISEDNSANSDSDIRSLREAGMESATKDELIAGPGMECEVAIFTEMPS